jgi:DNA-binding beta-propeller fold protein YncE
MGWIPSGSRRLIARIPKLNEVGCLVFLFVLACRAAIGAQTDRASSTVRVAQGDVPLNLVETPEGVLVSLNSGYGAQYLLAYDEVRNQVRSRLELKSLWYGLDYDAAQNAFLASSGNDWVYEIPWVDGKFGAPKKIGITGCELTAGVVWLGAGNAVVACNLNHRAIKFEVSTGKVLASAETGEYPYGVSVLPGHRVAVSNWGQSSVTIFDASNLKPVVTIPVGSHPNAMLVLKQSHQLFVACSDSDFISVIDLHVLREVRRLNLHIRGSNLGGAQPNALAFDSSHGRLYVALAAINALGVFAMGENGGDEIQFQGIIPVGTYPTALAYSVRSHALYIADGHNSVTGPNNPSSGRETHGCSPGSDADGVYDYIGCLVGGGIEAISDALLEKLGEQMTSLAVQIYGSRRQPLSPDATARVQYFSAHSNPVTPIRHVIYVIKENRTYDQVLGDMPEGNGEPDIVLFGEPVTPNQHALARQYILFDNFFVDGDVSADGHLWSTAAEATDYINKLWPSAYSGRLLHYNIWGPDYEGDETHDRPVAAPESGFVWDTAQKAGISYRDYGERCDAGSDEHPERVISYLHGLQGHYDSSYNDVIGYVTDQVRIDEFEREFRKFEQNDDLPQLVIMHVGNDHTVGTKPGHFTPRSMVADNDLAVGRLVDLVSHSHFWATTAIFILEDDAQDGPDHVDAHRSLLFVISPFTQLHKVEHARFSTVSVLKTIEQILGLPSLTYFDDRAPSLLVDFEKQPSLEPYTAAKPAIPLDEKNPPHAFGAKASARWDFSRPDAAPEMELNRVIWKSVKGRHSEPPASVFNVQVRMDRQPGS